MFTNICKHCYKVFKSRYKTYYCQKCKEVDFKQFDDIEEYLKEFPNSNALQISQNLGITAFEVLGYLKEGRLKHSKGSFSQLED